VKKLPTAENGKGLYGRSGIKGLTYTKGGQDCASSQKCSPVTHTTREHNMCRWPVSQLLRGGGDGSWSSAKAAYIQTCGTERSCTELESLPLGLGLGWGNGFGTAEMSERGVGGEGPVAVGPKKRHGSEALLGGLGAHVAAKTCWFSIIKGGRGQTPRPVQ